MRSILIYVISSLLIQTSNCIAFDSPSKQFLNKYPIENIARAIHEQKSESFDTDKFFPFFLSVLEQEDETFFGYHATTVSHLIFHESVKATLEALYGYDFPEDFYFLRAPDSSAYSVSNTAEFIKKYSRPELSLSDKRKFIEYFLLNPLKAQEEFNVPTLECGVVEDLYRTLLFYSPGEPATEKSETQVQQDLMNFISKHASNKSAMLEALTEWFKNPLQAERTDEEDEFLFPILHPFDDTAKEQQALLLSMNIALFSNFTLPSESTAHVFAKGQSIDLNNGSVQKKLKKFFKIAGIDETIADTIYSYADSLLNIEQGVLLQFFDIKDTEAARTHLDTASYVCATYGQPNFSILPSLAVPNFLSMKCTEIDNSELGHLILHPQLRLICIPSSTLNPFSWLKIKEYDMLNSHDKEQLREFIRMQIVHAQRDPAKVTDYKTYLDTIWH